MRATQPNHLPTVPNKVLPNHHAPQYIAIRVHVYRSHSTSTGMDMAILQYCNTTEYMFCCTVLEYRDTRVKCFLVADAIHGFLLLAAGSWKLEVFV